MSDDELKELRELGAHLPSRGRELLSQAIVEIDRLRAEVVKWKDVAIAIVPFDPDNDDQIYDALQAWLKKYEHLKSQLADAVEALEGLIENETCGCGSRNFCQTLMAVMERGRKALERIKEGK